MSDSDVDYIFNAAHGVSPSVLLDRLKEQCGEQIYLYLAKAIAPVGWRVFTRRNKMKGLRREWVAWFEDDDNNEATASSFEELLEHIREIEDFTSHDATKSPTK